MPKREMLQQRWILLLTLTKPQTVIWYMQLKLSNGDTDETLPCFILIDDSGMWKEARFIRNQICLRIQVDQLKRKQKTVATTW